MNVAAISAIASRAMYIALIIGAPLLIGCLVVGVVVSIFQATTQINEQSLSFVPKIIVVVAIIAIMGSWMAGQLMSFTREVFAKIISM